MATSHNEETNEKLISIKSNFTDQTEILASLLSFWIQTFTATPFSESRGKKKLHHPFRVYAFPPDLLLLVGPLKTIEVSLFGVDELVKFDEFDVKLLAHAK